MRIIQLLTTLSFGDAVSNDTVALKEAIARMGFETAIYAENIDKRLPEGFVHPFGQMPELHEDDVLIYHLSTGTKLNYIVDKYPCRKMMIYHNVTPPEYFRGYSPVSYDLCREGLNGVRYLAHKMDYCLADSAFNKADLVRMGYQCPIDVLPILIAFEDYKKTPDRKILRRFDDDYTNILFTGRIAPNKKHEDIIAAFYYYKKYINKKSRLFLVGSYGGTEKYYAQLKEYVKQLELKDVFFTGHIRFEEILAYYKAADIFLCMSEHEGFCVPLVEAMFFDVPIIAYDSTAIAGTLGGSGILLSDKNPWWAAEWIDQLVTHMDLKNKVLMNQRIRLKDFSHDRIYRLFESYVKGFLGGC